MHRLNQIQRRYKLCKAVLEPEIWVRNREFLMWTWTEISNFFGAEVAKFTKFIEQIVL